MSRQIHHRRVRYPTQINVVRSRAVVAVAAVDTVCVAEVVLEVYIPKRMPRSSTNARTSRNVQRCKGVLLLVHGKPGFLLKSRDVLEGYNGRGSIRWLCCVYAGWLGEFDH